MKISLCLISLLISYLRCNGYHAQVGCTVNSPPAVVLPISLSLVVSTSGAVVSLKGAHIVALLGALIPPMKRERITHGAAERHGRASGCRFL